MKEKLLNLLMECEDYISGEEIGEKLGVSRAAVWKNINALRKDGYIIEAVTNKGYKLDKKSDVISPLQIEKSLNTRYMGKKIIYHETVTSTNDVCKEIADESPEGTAVTCDQQTGGKGRLGRVWKSPKGTGVWISIILKPDISPMSVSSVTLAAGLAVCRTVKKVSGLEAGIKWPNDVYVNGKKLCGILTEMSAQIEKVDYVIVGIGINANTEYFPEELENIACSLYTEACVKFDRNLIIKTLLEEFENIYDKFNMYGFSAIRSEYEKECINIGRRVNVISKDGFEGTAIGVNSDGELIVRKDTGEEITVFSGEVSIRNINQGGFI